MEKFRLAFLASPVELLFGFAMVVVGVLGFKAPGWYGILGQFTAISGTIIVTYGLTKSFTKESASSELMKQLSSLTQQLGLVSGQIGQAAQNVRTGTTEADTGIALILQASMSLGGLISNIQRITGDAFNPEELIATVQRIEDLATLLASGSTNEESGLDKTEAIMTEIDSLKRQLSSQLKGPPKARTFLQETVSCPSCATSSAAVIGTVTGDRASLQCPQCELQFEAYRLSDGSIVSAERGKTRLAKIHQFNISCPTCERSIPVTCLENERNAIVRYCLGCIESGRVNKLLIDPEVRNLLSYEAEDLIYGDLYQLR